MFAIFDLVIFIIVALYVIDGYRRGFIKTFIDVLGVVISLIIALKFYSIASTMLSSAGLEKNLSIPVGFLAVWILMQLFFYGLSALIFHYYPTLGHENPIDKATGTIPGFIKGLMISAILLMFIVILPFSSNFKESLSKSVISGNLIKETAYIENQMASIFGHINDTVSLYSVVSDQNKIIQLDFKTNAFTPSDPDEQKMLALVNQDRIKVGLKPLEGDLLLRNVARAYAMDMLQNGYFGHISLSGSTPQERLRNANVAFTIAGENLALAPSIDLAFVGLMNSPSHRENILGEYKKVGIGVMDAGMYGKMIVQEFTD